MNKEDIQPNKELSPKLEFRAPRTLKPYANNARTHSKKQLKLITDSIKRFGFTNPVLLSDEDEIIAGHGRVMAAIDLNMDHVPVIRLSHLSDTERRAYVLADNRLAEHAGWDQDLLAIKLQALTEMDFDLSITGFEIAEIDMLFEATSDETASVSDALHCSAGPDVTQRGDVWQLDRIAYCVEMR